MSTLDLINQIINDEEKTSFEDIMSAKVAERLETFRKEVSQGLFGEATVYDPITKKMVKSKPIKTQAGGGWIKTDKDGKITDSDDKSRIGKMKENLDEESLEELTAGSPLKGKKVTIDSPGHAHHGKTGTVIGGASNSNVQSHIVKFSDGAQHSFSHSAVKRVS